MISPSTDLIVPISTASAACAVIGVRADADMAAANTAARPMIVKPFAFLMALFLIRACREPLLGARRRGLREYRLDILDDRADLSGLETIPETRHARGAITDVFAHQFLVAAQP